jgi:hypothetical protein
MEMYVTTDINTVCITTFGGRRRFHEFFHEPLVYTVIMKRASIVVLWQESLPLVRGLCFWMLCGVLTERVCLLMGGGQSVFC